MNPTGIPDSLGLSACENPNTSAYMCDQENFKEKTDEFGDIS